MSRRTLPPTVRGIPMDTVDAGLPLRMVSVGKDRYQVVEIQPIHPNDVVISYINPGYPECPRFTFGYHASGIAEHPNYVLVQAAVAVCDPRDKFVKGLGRKFVTDILSNVNLVRHLAFSVHFPMASMLRVPSYRPADSRTSGTPTRWDFPGSRLLQNAIQDAIYEEHLKTINLFNQVPIVFEDEVEQDPEDSDLDFGDCALSADFPDFVHPSNQKETT